MNKSIKNLYRTGLIGLTSLSLASCGSNLEESAGESIREERSSRNERVAFGENHWTNRRATTQLEPYVENFAGLNMKMIPISGGTVYLPDGSLRYVEDFFIGEKEVSVNQFITFLEISRYDPNPENVGISKPGPMDFIDMDSNSPVTWVSVKNAEYMAKYLSARSGRDYSLPFLSEQIIASFGPEFRLGEGLPKDVTLENANIAWGDKKDILSVGSLKPNRYGLYDIIGNAMELAVVDQEPDRIRPGSGRGMQGFAWDGRMFSFSSGAYTSREAFKIDYSGRYPALALEVLTSDGVHQVDYISRGHVGFRLVSRPKKED
jgi:formylglycine-generating enzyme required for sulfatase activity